MWWNSIQSFAEMNSIYHNSQSESVAAILDFWSGRKHNLVPVRFGITLLSLGGFIWCHLCVPFSWACSAYQEQDDSSKDLPFSQISQGIFEKIKWGITDRSNRKKEGTRGNYQATSIFLAAYYNFSWFTLVLSFGHSFVLNSSFWCKWDEAFDPLI